MSQAAVLGFVCGAFVLVGMVTYVLGRFIRRPILPAIIAASASALLSIHGNDGVNLMHVMGYALSGTAWATLRAWRELRRARVSAP